MPGCRPQTSGCGGLTSLTLIDSERLDDFPAVSVRALVAILPPVVLAVLTQRWIVRGLTLGAVKG